MGSRMKVEETLSKIASNIHTWKDLEATDSKDMLKVSSLLLSIQVL
jgi:hypothetical protein